MITIEYLPDLIKEYEIAVKEEKESFIFLGHELMTRYAKYLIEYLETIKR